MTPSGTWIIDSPIGFKQLQQQDRSFEGVLIQFKTTSHYLCTVNSALLERCQALAVMCLLSDEPASQGQVLILLISPLHTNECNVLWI